MNRARHEHLGRCCASSSTAPLYSIHHLPAPGCPVGGTIGLPVNALQAPHNGRRHRYRLPAGIFCAATAGRRARLRHGCGPAPGPSQPPRPARHKRRPGPRRSGSKAGRDNRVGMGQVGTVIFIPALTFRLLQELFCFWPLLLAIPFLPASFKPCFVCCRPFSRCWPVPRLS